MWPQLLSAGCYGMYGSEQAGACGWGRFMRCDTLWYFRGNFHWHAITGDCEKTRWWEYVSDSCVNSHWCEYFNWPYSWMKLLKKNNFFAPKMLKSAPKWLKLMPEILKMPIFVTQFNNLTKVSKFRLTSTNCKQNAPKLSWKTKKHVPKIGIKYRV
jgi:hypothetical protein